MDVIEELKFLGKFKKKKIGGGGLGGGGLGRGFGLVREEGGGQGGCERRIEVFVKIQKKSLGEGVRGVRGGGGVGLGGQGGCDRRIEVLGKLTKKMFVFFGGGRGCLVGGGVGLVELKFL